MSHIDIIYSQIKPLLNEVLRPIFSYIAYIEAQCLKMSQRPKKEKPMKRPRDPPMSDTMETNK